MPSPLRARLRRAVLGKTDAKIARQQRQVDAQAKDLSAARAGLAKLERAGAADPQVKKTQASLVKSVDQLKVRVTELTRRLDGMATPVASLTDRANKGDADLRARDVEFELRRAQLGTVETRLDRLEQGAGPVSTTETTEPTEATEAASLLADIRREHEQIRVRMQIITLYEERLRRVEESLMKLYDGDHRHRL